MNYLKIDKEDVCNGEGLRVVLWLSGCSHKCKGCQNPQTWDVNSGIPFDKSAKEELFRELDKDYISGLTISGGDPLFEDNIYSIKEYDVLDLVNEMYERYEITEQSKIYEKPKKSIWIYSGYTWAQLKDTLPSEGETDRIRLSILKRKILVKKCDVLIDGQYIESKRDISLPYRGSSNQRLIDIQKSLQKGEIVLWQT